jgi:phosphoserine phosphatase
VLNIETGFIQSSKMSYILHSLNENLANQIFGLGQWVKNRKHIVSTIDKDLNLMSLRQTHKVDINKVPQDFSFEKASLFISDMDSTLINIECIDEIADFANLKQAVSQITEAAMQGKLDFSQSLHQRVALLKGLSLDTLQKVFDERLQVNQGGEYLIEILKQKKIKTALVSGGFTFFVDKLQQKLLLDDVLANQLEVANDKLTGQVAGSVIDAQAKADFLKQLCQKYQINIKNTIAIGDGANDLLMMAEAGLSIAYHAKESVKQKTDIVIDYGGLDTVLDFF